MSSDKLDLDEVRARVLKLELPVHDYVLFGSVPMLVHGLIETVNDIDILARGSAWRKALSFKNFERAPGGDKVILLGNGIDIFSGWMDFDKEAILARATVIDGLPYADLRDVLEFKQELNRAKDQAHLSKLLTYLAAS